MDCKFRINGICEIYEIECDNPQENNPDNYNQSELEIIFLGMCGCYEPIESK